MTKERRKSKNTRNMSKVLLVLSFFFLTALFIKNSGIAADYVRSALSLCVRTVIPSVFPCTVIAGIFVALGGGEVIGTLLARPMRFIFGIGGAGAAVIILGFTCGFPVGAVTGVALVLRGELSENELSRLMLFSNLPSPAFVISVVGENMLGDRAIGIRLYLILLSVAILTGVIMRLFGGEDSRSSVCKRSEGLAAGVAASISSAALSMLNICASVVFFSVLTKTALLVMGSFLESELFSAIIAAFFEMSSGCATASVLGGKIAVCLSAFALGWSGLGVHFQIISAVGRLHRLPLYFAVKFLSGVLSAVLAFVTI